MRYPVHRIHCQIDVRITFEMETKTVAFGKRRFTSAKIFWAPPKNRNDWRDDHWLMDARCRQNCDVNQTRYFLLFKWFTFCKSDLIHSAWKTPIIWVLKHSIYLQYDTEHLHWHKHFPPFLRLCKQRYIFSHSWLQKTCKSFSPQLLVHCSRYICAQHCEVCFPNLSRSL